MRQKLIDPYRVCERLGLLDGFRRQPGGLLIRCPAHDDRKPSCSIYRGADHTLAVRCHACGFSGDVFTLIAHVRGLDTQRDFREVLRAAADVGNMVALLDELDGIRAPRIRRFRRASPPAMPPASKRTASLPPPPAEAPPDSRALAYDALARALIERCPLREDPEASAYLAHRHIFADAEARDVAALPPGDRQRALLSELRARFGADPLVAAGLVRSPAAVAFRAPSHRLVIPWMHPDGRVASMQRRVIGAPVGDAPKYLFPPGVPLPEHPYDALHAVEALADLRRVGRDPQVAFVEGALDALAMHALERRDAQLDRPPRVVLGLPSATVWRQAWAHYARGAVAHVALDEDRAGLAKVKEIARDLHAAGARKVLRTRPHAGKDWNEQLDRMS